MEVTAFGKNKHSQKNPEERTADNDWQSAVEVRRMAREYASGTLETAVRQIERARPALLRNAGIEHTKDSEEEPIQVDERRISQLSGNDRELVRYYIQCREKIYFLRHAVDCIKDSRLREVAEDTLLRGIRCEDLQEKYFLGRKQMFNLKRDAVNEVTRQWKSRSDSQ